MCQGQVHTIQCLFRSAQSEIAALTCCDIVQAILLCLCMLSDCWTSNQALCFMNTPDLHTEVRP